IALLIVVVVITVVIVVVITVVVVVVVTVVVVVVVTVVVVVVVGICRSAPTILGQMTNPLAVIVPRWTRTFMIVVTLGTQRFRPGV
ncbi:hypothetical protein Tco_0589469, partial [Tanacetum coccineum]